MAQDDDHFQRIFERQQRRFEELESRIASPGFYDDPMAAATVTREHGHLSRLIELWQNLQSNREQLAETRELTGSDDEEFKTMAQEELPRLEEHVDRLEREVRFALLPPDPTGDRDAILEIRAGTGGDEASLFAADLLRMYTRYAEEHRWKLEPLDSSPSEVGGLREVVVKVTGEQVFRFLKYESGVHRVQRVPATEAQGRIHTSTATVAVLPEAEEVDVQLRAEDLRIDVCRAGGPGGQGVNTTDSAVQVLHLPTGILVKCQDGRSQHKNKERALSILRARLLEQKQREEAASYSEHRRSLIGSGGREEKIRTYNFPQNRVTDHRINLTLYNLEEAMQGGIEPLVTKLQEAEMEERLRELQQRA